MPKQLGFDLYAMIIHYKDGTTCNCYARKTDNWYYFSDKMDFRIQLAGDNRTITLQQWRRTHYSSSWYESGLLDYVELMVFGETYLQSELNPMRDDISTNHTDIVNNYNEYYNNKVITDQTIEDNHTEYLENKQITDQTIVNNYNTFLETRQQMWNVVGNSTSQDQYTKAMRLALEQNSTALLLIARNTTLELEKFADNFNTLVDKLYNMLNNQVFCRGQTGISLPTKNFTNPQLQYTRVNADGTMTEAELDIPTIEEGPEKRVTTVSIDEIQTQINDLSRRVSALESKS